MESRHLCKEVPNSSSSSMRTGEFVAIHDEQSVDHGQGVGNSQKREIAINTEDRYHRNAEIIAPANNSRLAPWLIASCLIHALAIVLTTTLFMDQHRVQQNPMPVRLVELSYIKQDTAPQAEEKTAPLKKPAMTGPKPKVEKVESAESMATQTPVEQAAAPAPTSPAKEAMKSPESQIALPTDPVTGYATAPADSGGTAVGAGDLFSKEETGMMPATTGGAGTASSGLGRDSGAPGLPAPTTPLRTGREAKPVQTVRATYPPMALRMGLEGDVTLRIAIDSKGTVTDAEIIKSGGAGFDHEALKAVKQARFEPAQNDGKNVPAEFTYVYRFRMRK